MGLCRGRRRAGRDDGGLSREHGGKAIEVMREIASKVLDEVQRLLSCEGVDWTFGMEDGVHFICFARPRKVGPAERREGLRRRSLNWRQGARLLRTRQGRSEGLGLPKQLQTLLVLPRVCDKLMTVTVPSHSDISPPPIQMAISSRANCKRHLLVTELN